MSRLTWYRVFLAVGFVAALGLASTVASQRTAASMADAAQGFLASLTSEQRGMAALPFDSDDRERFHYIPTEMHPRQGLKIEDMDETQRQAAHALLKAGLSQIGYSVAVDVMELEAVLAALEQSGRLSRNPEWYFVSVFGAPGPTGTWGWRVEGHHLSLHFTVVDGDAVASTPSFFGSNPAEVRDAVRQQFGVFPRAPFYKRIFVAAGFPEATEGAWSDGMVDGVAISGGEAEVAHGLRELYFFGATEILASPVAAGSNPAASLRRTMGVLAEVSKTV